MSSPPTTIPRLKVISLAVQIPDLGPKVRLTISGLGRDGPDQDQHRHLAEQQPTHEEMPPQESKAPGQSAGGGGLGAVGGLEGHIHGQGDGDADRRGDHVDQEDGLDGGRRYDGPCWMTGGEYT